jgi:hypothetical protein
VPLDWRDLMWMEWYRASGHVSINRHLRRPCTRDGSELDEQIERAIASLDGLMRPLTCDQRVFRGVRLAQALAPGQTLHEPGFCSTTLLRPVARSFARHLVGRHSYLIELHVPAGTPFIPVMLTLAHKTWLRREDELLLGRGQTIRIDEILDDRAVPLVRASVHGQIDEQIAA